MNSASWKEKLNATKETYVTKAWRASCRQGLRGGRLENCVCGESLLGGGIGRCGRRIGGGRNYN